MTKGNWSLVCYFSIKTVLCFCFLFLDSAGFVIEKRFWTSPGLNSIGRPGLFATGTVIREIVSRKYFIIRMWAFVIFPTAFFLYPHFSIRMSSVFWHPHFSFCPPTSCLSVFLMLIAVLRIGVRAPSDLRAVTLLPKNNAQSLKLHGLYKRAQITLKTETFTILTSNETIIVPKLQWDPEFSSLQGKRKLFRKIG